MNNNLSVRRAKKVESRLAQGNSSSKVFAQRARTQGGRDSRQEREEKKVHAEQEVVFFLHNPKTHIHGSSDPQMSHHKVIHGETNEI
jgi:hypothetical protein